MSLPIPIVQAIKLATVVGPTFRARADFASDLEVYFDIRSWLESFDKTLQDRKWRSATHQLCMLGLDRDRVLAEGESQETFGDPTLVWLGQNQETYNGLAAQVLADHRSALGPIKAYVRADIRRLKAGEEPEVFAIQSYAEWMLVWLEQI